MTIKLLILTHLVLFQHRLVGLKPDTGTHNILSGVTHVSNMSHIKLFVDGYTDNMTMYDIMNKLSVDSDGLPLFYKITFCWIVVDMFCVILLHKVWKKLNEIVNINCCI